MKVKVNNSGLYEQNEDMNTGAVADGEKGNTTVDRTTCLYSRFTIVYGQVQKSQDSGCVEGTGCSGSSIPTLEIGISVSRQS